MLYTRVRVGDMYLVIYCTVLEKLSCYIRFMLTLNVLLYTSNQRAKMKPLLKRAWSQTTPDNQMQWQGGASTIITALPFGHGMSIQNLP